MFPHLQLGTLLGCPKRRHSCDIGIRWSARDKLVLIRVNTRDKEADLNTDRKGFMGYGIPNRKLSSYRSSKDSSILEEHLMEHQKTQAEGKPTKRSPMHWRNSRPLLTNPKSSNGGEITFSKLKHDYPSLRDTFWNCIFIAHQFCCVLKSIILKQDLIGFLIKKESPQVKQYLFLAEYLMIFRCHRVKFIYHNYAKCK